MNSERNKSYTTFLHSFFSIFASARAYTIFILVIAQYLSARYILAPQFSWWTHLTDKHLFFLVLSSSLAIAAGYLINNFYDAEKDQINRPQQYLIHQIVSIRKQLFLYAFLNLISLVLAASVSFRALLFFFIYIGGIWLYSHLLKKEFWASNLFAAFLAITPFFAIGLYYDNMTVWVLYHALFLFIIILIRDLVKDLKNFRGDWVRQYKTVAITFGVKITKQILSALILFSFIPIFIMIQHRDLLGGMYFYFILCVPYLLVILILIWRSTTQKAYLWIHNLLKFLILAGVFCIVFIRTPLH